jgi:hypothetical protein
MSRVTGSWSGRFGLTTTNERGVWLYEPDANNPLTYTAADGKSYVIAAIMDTDGATIPRFMGVIPGLSKWDWPEAAILHDALWEARYSGKLRVGFCRSNRLLREAIVSLGWSRGLAWLVFCLVTVFGWWFWIAGERGEDE